MSITREEQREEYGNPGTCPRKGCEGVMEWEEGPRPVYAQCGTCGWNEKIHCCDECAYGPWTAEDEAYLA